MRSEADCVADLGVPGPLEYPPRQQAGAIHQRELEGGGGASPGTGLDVPCMGRWGYP